MLYIHTSKCYFKEPRRPYYFAVLLLLYNVYFSKKCIFPQQHTISSIRLTGIVTLPGPSVTLAGNILEQILYSVQYFLSTIRSTTTFFKKAYYTFSTTFPKYKYNMATIERISIKLTFSTVCSKHNKGHNKTNALLCYSCNI